MSAAVFLAAALAVMPHEELLDLFRKLMRQGDPFVAAPRAKGSRQDVWRRYDGDGCFVELGPFVGHTPQKIVIMTGFPTRAEAVAYAGRINAAIPIVPQPRLPAEIDAPFSYRGTIVIERKPVGLEIDLAEVECEWRVTVTLIAGGPRVVVPIGGG